MPVNPKAIRLQLLDELAGWAAKDHARSLKSKYRPAPPPAPKAPEPEPEADPLAEIDPASLLAD